ncbi:MULTISPECIES: crotonase/enoyl-CoA hydratase family protein [unclassified Bradyrhizobium]|uniref:crotonase/enoyl-CoA hydratase family protein n=1 Tax=unclassified Bradyrhizobium TaxID=2631580 RepID=UPI0015CED104|nr:MULTISPECIES: crotonase/enoyl-CoA hydratase family protein [unclassified Bradyrhizobium]MBB4260535.1 enoyl-CoA hydratase/carnithine racemase [Bradyrhizobium sp. CIR3A]NYG46805.1 enoyl-CoA hydratase/carnithine racemase [Bradyrhizobium sp. IAR9]
MAQRVTVQITDGIASVKLTRADKMNALDTEMTKALVNAGEGLKSERGLRAVVLSGEGRAFCAGLDMDQMGSMASGERTIARSLVESARTPAGANPPQQVAMVWREVPVPVIAAVHGVAFGGGLQLALGADVRIVAPDARLSVLEIKWGLVPDMAGMALMRHLVRDDLARILTFTGRVLSGGEAVETGLATQVSDDPQSAAMALAREIAAKSPDAIRAAKRLLNMALYAEDVAVLRAESEEQASLIGSPNQIEAVTSNLQKRLATFVD